MSGWHIRISSSYFFEAALLFEVVFFGATFFAAAFLVDVVDVRFVDLEMAFLGLRDDFLEDVVVVYTAQTNSFDTRVPTPCTKRQEKKEQSEEENETFHRSNSCSPNIFERKMLLVARAGKGGDGNTRKTTKE